MPSRIVFSKMGEKCLGEGYLFSNLSKGAMWDSLD